MYYVFLGLMEPVNDLQYPALLKSECDEVNLKPTEVYLPSSTNLDNLLSLFKSVADLSAIAYDVDFLVDGKLLRETLQEHFIAYDLSTEQPVSVELIKKTSAPDRKPDINADDWISCITEFRNCIYFGCSDNSVCFVNDCESKLLYKTKYAVQSVDAASCMLAVGSRSSTIDVLDIADADVEKTAKLKWTLKGHNGPVASVAFEKSGERLASVGQDGMLKIWSTVEQSEFHPEVEVVSKKKSKLSKESLESLAKSRTPLVTLSAHQEPATCCFWCQDKYSHEIITGGFDNSLKVFDLNTLKPRASYTRDRPYNTVDRSFRNQLVATACFDTKIRIYDIRVEKEVMVVQAADAHDELVSCLNWSPDNENLFISGSYDTLVKIWDFRSAKVPLYDIKTSEGKVLSCLWHERDIYFGGEDCKLYCFANAS